MKKLILFVALCLGSLLPVHSQQEADSAQYLYAMYREAWARGDFVQSRMILARILDEYPALPEYNLALVHNALGMVQYEMGDFQGAREQYRLADSLTPQMDPLTVKLKINIYNNYSLLHDWLGDYAAALLNFDKAIRMLEALPDGDADYYSKLSMLQFNKGIVYFRLERYEDALEVMHVSERIKESHRQPYLGSVYFNLARIYQILGDTALAEDYYRKSIGRWTAESGEDYYQLANVYLYFGLFMAVQGKQEPAREYFDRALDTYFLNYGHRHPLTSAAYEKLADFYLGEKDFPRALEMVQNAMIAGTTEFDSLDFFANPGIGQSLHDLTILKCFSTKAKALEGLADEAGEDSLKIRLLEAALRAGESALDVLYQLQGSFVSPESRTFLVSGRKDLFSTGIRLNLRLYGLTMEGGYLEQAYLLAARGKSNELIFEMHEKEWLYLESLTDSVASKVLGLQRRIDSYSNQIRLESMEIQSDSARISAWKENLFRAQNELMARMEELKEKYPQIEQFEGSDSEFSLDRLRTRIGRHATLVEYYISDRNSAGTRTWYAFILDGREMHTVRGEIDSTLEKYLLQVRQQLHAFHPSTESAEQYEQLRSALYHLYLRLFNPLESYVHHRNLIIVPDEELAYLSFDALITRLEEETVRNYAGWPYLLYRYNFSYAYNSQTFAKPVRPGFIFPFVMAFVPGYSRSGSDSTLLLRGAKDEVAGILSMVKGNMYSGIRLQDKLELLEGRDTILHFAMHAFPGGTDAQRPYLLLEADHEDDPGKRLYDYEINSMRLANPMVVLSSCETGSGQLRSGEGIISLSRSFLLAGAASVVHTLWPAEDLKVREVIIRFYQELKRGRSKAKALSLAKQYYLSHSPPTYAHPYYWAACQITGNSNPLIISWKWVFCPVILLAACLGGYFLIRRSFFTRSTA